MTHLGQAASINFLFERRTCFLIPATAGIVSVHGSFRNFTAEAAENIKGRVLILHGAEDPVAPMEELNAVISQLVNLYSGTTHGFSACTSEEFCG
jgi:dienelactone hydrolase